MEQVMLVSRVDEHRRLIEEFRRQIREVLDISAATRARAQPTHNAEPTDRADRGQIHMATFEPRRGGPVPPDDHEQDPLLSYPAL